MKAIKILFTLLLGLFVANPAHALLMKNVTLTQSDPTQDADGVQHKINATLRSDTNVHTILMQYCTRASTDTEGTTVNGCDVPENLDLSTLTTGDASDWSTLTQANWTPLGSGGLITMTASSDYDPAAADTAVSWEVGGVGNARLNATDNDKECIMSSNQSSATCFIRLKTQTAASADIDTGFTTYTVSAEVLVSATVDPTFTFVVTGVNSNVTTYDGTTDLITSVSSAYNTLPFGNLTANTPKYAAHQLFVTTNTGSGYDITARLTRLITGVYSGDNVDDFPGVWTTGGSTWYRPTGTSPNTETAWFGASTTDASVDGGAPTGFNFGGVELTSVIVKDLASADDGTTGTYVTYAMEANVFQPSDSYSGTLVYNALPTY